MMLSMPRTRPKARVWIAVAVLGVAGASVIVGVAGFFVGGFKTDSGLSCSKATGAMAGTFWCDVDPIWGYLFTVGIAVFVVAFAGFLVYAAREIRRR